jgi:hypothetical protein
VELFGSPGTALGERIAAPVLLAPVTSGRTGMVRPKHRMCHSDRSCHGNRRTMAALGFSSPVGLRPHEPDLADTCSCTVILLLARLVRLVESPG